MATLGTAYVNVRTNQDKLPSDLSKAKRTVSAAVGRMQKTVDTLTFGHVGISAAAFSAVFVAGMKKSIDAASDLEEVTNKFGVVFGDQVGAAEKWADILVDSYAMSTREAKQYLSSVQDLLVPMGLQSEAAAELSNEIVKLSADLGSFNNMPTARVMDDIQSALVGNYETMKKYGVVLTAARVQQEAMNMGLARSKNELTAADKAQAAYKLIIEGSTAAIGDMARTSGSYENQSKKLRANVENLSSVLGNELLPVATDVVTTFNNWIAANQGIIQQDISRYVENAAAAMERIWKIVSYDPDMLEYGLLGLMLAGRKGAVIVGGMAHMINWAQNLAGAFENAKKGLVEFSEIATANFQELEKLAQRSLTYTGKIGPQTPGYAGYSGSAPTMPTVTVTGSPIGGGGNSGITGGKPGNSVVFDYSLTAPGFYADAPSIAGVQDPSQLARAWIDPAVTVHAEAMETMQEKAIDTADIMKNAFDGWATSFSSDLTDMLWQGEMTFSGMAESFGKYLTQMVLQKQISDLSTGLLSFLPFAKGGVIDRPTIFPMARGMGLAGEAGDEAILPLTRTSGGDLGVKAAGAGSNVQVIINEAPAGTKVEKRQTGDITQFIVNLSAQDVARRGPLARTLESTYGFSRLGRRA
ncbi:hypothetical protein DSCW_07590 [Desulfosarcina widdelii]|uniref:Bacteriophage tail tape measure C-terminal domain-containing protein n=1 Tax=Desulfosarcina widdelii TaxID=947919 RepID=A0A5K7YU87_9BACT|nr:phage tail tape measure protein [Desulfosarcina widdelii]BBO73342.1 hypothetical protein DSCW_07590 [Desulfosarcina widdelii]